MTDRSLHFLLLAFAACLVMMLVPVYAHAESALDEEIDGDCVYTMVDESGAEITARAGRMYEGDEYISSDNTLYRVIRTDDAAYTAVATRVGQEQENSAQAMALMREALAATSGTKKIAMYSTHSDESYVPSDGESSKIGGAGIYDVGEALAKNLQALGIDTTYSKETFFPHDAGAYRRSRSTAEELLKGQPDALIDVHRDAIPASQYETEVDGEDVSKVRLFVGRSNPNGDANRAFAKELKAAADEKYPGLVKDIYIGKGNYNQELYPKAILLEMGTHEIEKEKVIESTKYMADVLNDVLFGGSAKAEGAPSANTKKKETSAATKGIIWAVAVALVGALIYAFVATGTFKGMAQKFSRGTSEVTGGVIGKKPGDREKKE